MKYSFRAAGTDDAVTISRLGRKIWYAHYPGIISPEQIEFMLNTRYSPDVILKGMANGELYFLAFDEKEKEPIALADLELKGDSYFLHKFYVDVAKHRGGVGTGFLEYIISLIMPGKPIRLQVNRINFKAINFYFKAGFVIESTGDFDIGGGYYMNDFIMIKKR